MSSGANSNLLLAVEWLWSCRGRNIWWTPGVLTRLNQDPSAPKLTDVEAISIFKILQEKELIFPTENNGQPVFVLHETKEREWTNFIEELKSSPAKNDGEPRRRDFIWLILEGGVLAYLFWMLADFLQNSDRPWWNTGLIFIGIGFLVWSVAHTVLTKFRPDKRVVFGVFICVMVAILSLKFLQFHLFNNSAIHRELISQWLPPRTAKWLHEPYSFIGQGKN